MRTIREAVTASLNRRGLDGAAYNPWFFPTAERYGAMLTRRGFEIRTITLFDRPTVLPGDVADWLETFAQPMLGAVPAAERRALVEEVRDAVEPALHDPERGWIADYTRLRFAAGRPR